MADIKLTKSGDFDLAGTLAKFKKKKKSMPKVIGNIALRHFKLSFRKGGFTDKTFVPWQRRFKRLSKTRVSRTVKERSNLIGPGQGALLRSVSLLKSDFDSIVLGTKGIRYAVRHNEGITDKLGRPMPKREFIGDSANLNTKVLKRIVVDLDEVFR